MTKKLFCVVLALFCASLVYAQSTITLNSKGNGKVVNTKDSFQGFETTFSFDEINSVTITGTEKGVFSALSISGAYSDGEYGTPELPVVKKMIAIPIGATPKVVVKDYTTTEYSLSEYNIEKIFPVQPSVSKSQNMDEWEFIYHEEAYLVNEYTRTPIAQFEELGTMRGMRLGMLFVYPIRYNPVAHTIIAYNDIDVEVIFENADYVKTQSLYQNTASPYFKQYQNITLNRNVYDDHPDLYQTPVRMLVIANRMFEETLQPWIEWKIQKGFYLDVNYTDDIGTTNAAIKTFCQNKYNAGIEDGTSPTFVILVGDVAQVPASAMGSRTYKQTDLYYGSVDGDYFPDMYYSRMSAQTVEQLENIIEKILYYEKYQFEDPSYLDDVLLIAGYDSNWNPRVGQPQINYAANYYYNEEHGFVNVHKYLTRPYNAPYANLENVGFVNYTAHCNETVWDEPRFNISNVNALTNEDKYFVAMGNCCLAADFGYGECIGETFIRGKKKGAVGYIGSSPSSYWGEDFHFSVGAYSGSLNTVTTPTLENTSDGCYDLSFRDADFNCLSSMVLGGNLSVTYASTTGCTMHVGVEYYWQAYNVLGDGSLMPYWSQADENEISHEEFIQSTETSFTVNALPGSYVALSYGGVLYGVGLADEDGVALIEFDAELPEDLEEILIVVTRNQYKPYIQTIPIQAGFFCMPPVSVVASVDEAAATVNLVWEEPERINDELLGYNVYRDGEKINTEIIRKDINVFSDANVFTGIHEYAVTASYENCEESEMSEEGEASAVEVPALCLPAVELNYTTDNNGITLVWERPQINDIFLGYNVYRDEEKINAEPIEQETFTDENVTHETTYTYTVEMVYENCEESPLSDPLVIHFVGMEKLDANDYQVYPNPTDNYVIINGKDLKRVEIFNLKGQKIAEYTVNNNSLQINDLANYETGIYFIRMFTKEEQMIVKRLSIAR